MLRFGRILLKIQRVFQRWTNEAKEYEKSQYVCMGKFSRLHDESKIFNMQQASKIKIGCGSHIRGELCVYPYGNGIQIGDNCFLGVNSVIRAGNSVVIGNDVLIAHNVSILDTDSHEIDFLERAASYKEMLKNGHPISPGNVKTAPITIKDHAWISYNVCILKGVTIGTGAIVGAGSVVTHDVPDFAVVAGNPAKVIKNLGKEHA